MLSRLNHTQMLRYAGLFTWASVGIPLVSSIDFHGGMPSGDLLGWWIGYLGFGLCYWLLTRGIGRRQARTADYALLLVVTICAVAVSHFSGSGLAGGLLLAIAGVLPWYLPLGVGIGWLLLQNLALIPIFWTAFEAVSRTDPNYEGSPLRDAVLQAVIFIGYSSFAFIAGLVARRQAEAREEQRRLNAELRATRALLAESSRINERMRISRELHDLLGHHLTALSLNLEVASHMSQGRVQEHVRQAQSLAKLLLTDVREAVSQLREDDAIDLTEALRSVVDGVPGLDVQLDIPEQFHVEQPERAHLLLRLAQEAITNAVRHAQARRLILSVADDGDDLLMTARDDGRGADQFRSGNGLNGMRERLEQIGGQLDIETARGAGFCVRMRIPGRGLDLSPPREINLVGKSNQAAGPGFDTESMNSTDNGGIEAGAVVTNKETTA